ncbi:hypothetical protein NEOLEDRAFT_512450 [Neolentinus lepideus HHB14362 ss-1]|uniref:Uncharacterized protein n=1 Tax=Neolentinus lepideus HHB14362 ss-1 TaxID=1314782 RepID=A0A165RG66_9AGAM|nr:hypothetical protein NEOLEDRAFT_512450 [Neolentinus lepideus HHB14362 ss-1]
MFLSAPYGELEKAVGKALAVMGAQIEETGEEELKRISKLIYLAPVRFNSSESQGHDIHNQTISSTLSFSCLYARAEIWCYHHVWPLAGEFLSFDTSLAQQLSLLSIASPGIASYGATKWAFAGKL